MTAPSGHGLSVPERIARIEKECSGVWGASGVTSWERARLAEWKHRTHLSEKQEKVLRQVECKVFGGGDAGL